MALDNLRILRLQAENIKKIKVVEISPTGEVVVVTGRNGQGKTSVLDCILWALDGARSIQWKPIRGDEQKGFIQLDLGDDTGLKLQVTRRFTAQPDGEFTTSLKVVNEDGFKPSGEQTLLNTIVGALSFDPGVFMRADDAGQVKIIKDLIPDADFDTIEAVRKAAYSARTDFNREADRLMKAAQAVIVVGEETLPPEPIDTVDLTNQLSDLGNAARAYETEKSRRSRVDLDRLAHVESRVTWSNKAAEYRQMARDADDEVVRQTEIIARFDVQIADYPPLDEPADAADIRAQLDEANATNSKVAKVKERDKLLADSATNKADAEAETAKIAAADKQVLDLIAGADLPVTGLALQDGKVMLRGVPFNQASDAEQLRAALALGIAANPKLRVIRIRDGSLLDEDALEVVREVAKDEHFQIWMERVGTGEGGDEIIMENGEIKSA